MPESVIIAPVVALFKVILTGVPLHISVFAFVKLIVGVGFTITEVC